MYDSFAGNFIETSQGVSVKILRTGNDGRLFGVTGFERLVRQIGPAWREETTEDAQMASFLILRDDTVYDPSLIEWLQQGPGRALAAGSARGAHVRADQMAVAEAWVLGRGPKPEGLKACSPKEIWMDMDGPGLRPRPPYSFTPHSETMQRGEQRLFEAALTGHEDPVSGRLLKPVSFHLLRALSRLRGPAVVLNGLISLTTALALWQFFQHQSGAGLAAAVLAVFLSGLTGPLYRCTAQPRGPAVQFGGLTRVLLPPVIYGGWYIGAGLQAPVMLAVLLLAYAALHSLAAAFKGRHGAPLAMWRRGDFLLSRLAPAAMPTLGVLIAGWALNEPAVALAGIAGWMSLAAVYVLARLIMAERRLKTRAA